MTLICQLLIANFLLPWYDALKPSNNIVRRGQNKNAVPAECSALSFAHHALCRRLDRKNKIIILDKTKLFFAPNKALERSFTRLHA
jgi:hypothetical protein